MNRRQPMLQILHFRRVWFALGTVLLLVIIVASLVPVPKTGIQANDKLVHISMYFVLMAWFAQVIEPRYRLHLAIAFVSLGLALEIAQHATGYRSFEWADALANAAGVVIAWVAMHTVAGKTLTMVDSWLARLIRQQS